MNFDIHAVINNIIFYVPGIIIALSVHEWAHAYAAYKFGDTTAQRSGRLTLNPYSHIDPIGIIPIILGVLIGWAKPVPVNPFAVRNPRVGLPVIAFAGPLSNVIQMFLGLIVFAIYSNFIHPILGSSVREYPDLWIRCYVIVNFGLAIFNLFPVAPLDGSKVVTYFLPDHLAGRYDDWVNRSGMYPLIILFVVNMFIFNSLFNFDIFYEWVRLWLPLVDWSWELVGYYPPNIR